MVKKTPVITEAEVPVEPQPEAPKEVVPPEPIVPAKEQLPTDMVLVTVVIGTLQFEGGRFEHGETFQVTRERASQFEPWTIKVSEL